jgi:hypothetical protein
LKSEVKEKSQADGERFSCLAELIQYSGYRGETAFMLALQIGRWIRQQKIVHLPAPTGSIHNLKSKIIFLKVRLFSAQ